MYQEEFEPELMEDEGPDMTPTGEEEEEKEDEDEKEPGLDEEEEAI